MPERRYVSYSAGELHTPMSVNNGFQDQINSLLLKDNRFKG